ncbi:hypothetical protein QN345_17505, partial [Cryobacterium sp. 10I1]|nr:hypothetical protein [Cryobacterium sp. 10I1]
MDNVTFDAAQAHSGPSGAPRRVLVIGGGPAAHRFTEAMQARSTPGHGRELLVLGDEDHLPYDRVALSRRLVDSEDLTLGDRALWETPGVTYRGGSRVDSVDTAGR